MTVNWSEFAKLVDQHDKFLLVSHIRPDCDALGSELGMAQVLEALGKHVRIVNGHQTPPNLAFIDPEHRIQTIGVDVQPDDLNDIEVVIVLDTSAWVQLGDMADVVRQSSAKKIIVDHHVSEDDLDAALFKDTSAEATGRLVLDAANHLNVKVTPEIAMPLFAAIATDTGWFRFKSATSDTYRAAAQLIDAGADPAGIYGDLYEKDSIGRIRLRGLVLSRVQSELDGRLVYTYVLKDDFSETGAILSDTEDVINMTLTIAGTEFAVIMVEQPDGSGCKLSFRSRCHLDCSQIAEHFNGGGHKAAAGAFLPGSYDEIQSQVLDVVRAALR